MNNWFLYLVCLPVLVCVVGCEGINTKLGWPTADWHSGFWSIFGFLLVSILLMAAIKLAITTASETSNSSDAIAGIVILSGVAGVVLQMLPAASDGFQVIPLTPWGYSGCVSPVLSAAVWLLIAASVLAASSGSPDSATVFSTLILIALVGNLFLSFFERTTPTPATVVTNLLEESDSIEVSKPYENEIEEWRSKVSGLRLILNQLTADQQRLTSNISRLGNSSSYKSARAELLGEQRELATQIEAVEAELATVELAVVRAESRLRRLARHAAIHEGIKVKDTEFETMAQIQHELEEDLRELRQSDMLNVR